MVQLEKNGLIISLSPFKVTRCHRNWRG